MDEREGTLGGVDPMSTSGDYTTDPVAETGYGAGDVVEEDTYVVEVMDTSPYPSDMATAQAGGTSDDDLELQRERIERTRGNLGDTIDAIQEKLSPANLSQQATDAVKEATVGKAQQAVGDMTDSVQQAAGTVTDTASNFGSGIIETIRENPVPAALATLGLGWLIFSSRSNSNNSNGSQYSGGYGYTPGYTDQYGYGYTGNQGVDYQGSSYPGSSYQGSTGGVVDQAQNKVSQVADSAQGAVGDAVNTAQDTVGQVADTAQYQAMRAQGQLSRWMRTNPMGVALGTFALGVTLGLAIPETQKEDQLMGAAKDTLTNRAEEMVQDTAHKVENAAQVALGVANAASGSGSSSSSTSTGSQKSGKSSSSTSK